VCAAYEREHSQPSRPLNAVMKPRTFKTVTCGTITGVINLSLKQRDFLQVRIMCSIRSARPAYDIVGCQSCSNVTTVQL